VDYKTVEDPIEDVIKEMREAFRNAPVFWNPHFMYFGRYVTAKAKYIQAEGRWLYPDQAATYCTHLDDGGKLHSQRKSRLMRCDSRTSFLTDPSLLTLSLRPLM
jgi:hypothetical protein